MEDGNGTPHRSLNDSPLPWLELGAQIILLELYLQHSPLPPPVDGWYRKTERNEQIRQLYEQGEQTSDLAQHFGISQARVYQILKHA